MFEKFSGLRNFHRGEGGSFLVAGALFMFIFLGSATFAVDLSRYYNQKQELQEIADGAALAGGQALNQFKDNPDEAEAYRAVLDYIRSTQGDSYVDLYEVHSPTDVDGITVARFGGTLDTGCAEINCSDQYDTNYYRVGVVVYDQFEPYFLPRDVFGDRNTAVSNHAVAEVRPRPVFLSEDEPLDCGVYSDGIMYLSGNNFDASGADFCANSDINGGGSNNGTMGDIHLVESASFIPPGGGAGEVNQFSSPREMPEFPATSPADYDVNLQNFSSWSDLGACGGGPPGGPTTKALRTSGSDSANVVWESGGSAVCVESSGGDYTIDNNNGGQIERVDASPVTIYADGDLTFSGNGNGLNGGLYATGDFTVTGNDYEFVGDESALGGLAVWAEGDVDFQKNNITINGITGAGGNYSFGSPGGGTGPELSGVLVSGGLFELESNSNNALLEFDASKFDRNFLDVGGWSFFVQEEQKRPLYSQVKVRLID